MLLDKLKEIKEKTIKLQNMLGYNSLDKIDYDAEIEKPYTETPDHDCKLREKGYCDVCYPDGE